MYNINEHIIRELNNIYGGSEKKKTVILDDGSKYLLKLSDPVREANSTLSYINNAYSEYLGCKIAESIGLPVQKVILGEYTYTGRNNETHKRPACLCRDITYDTGLKMIELDKLALSDYNSDSKKITFKEQNELINSIKGIDNTALHDFYYDLFIFDALVGNTDRHNGNISILVNENETCGGICPVYDCGSSLLPMVSDEQLPLKNKDNL